MPDPEATASPRTPGPSRPGGETARPRATGRALPALAIAAVMLVAAAGALNYVRNYDIFWHLAGGEWMLAHGRVLDFDPFCVPGAPARPTEWVNVHWLFQVIAAALHALGGFTALSLLKAVLAAITLLLLALSVRRDVAPGWLIFCGLLAAAVMVGRVRARPEAFTLAFLAATIFLLERVRRGAGARLLWWLVPLLLAWVNMHGLYILGVGLIWSAVGGAALDRLLGRGELSGRLATRQALLPVLVATFACLVTPWPLAAAAHPFRLWTRVSGQVAYYSYIVTELEPTWKVLGAYPEALALVALTAAAMAICLLAGVLLARPRVPVAHFAWFAAFVFLAALARRNVGLLGPMCGYLLAWHGGAALRLLGQRLPRAARLRTAATVVMIGVALAAAAGFATEYVYRARGSALRFGAGLQRELYTIETAEFLADLPARGATLAANFGDGGVLIYYAHRARSGGVAAAPRPVWMDGRLEVHSLARFKRQNSIRNALRSAATAETVELPKEARFVVVRHNWQQHLSALMRCRRFRLVHVGGSAACFARTDGPWRTSMTAGAWRPPAGANLNDYDRPLLRDGTVSGAPVSRRRWYRQNPQSRNYRLGAMLLSLGKPDRDERPADVGLLRQRCSLLAVRHLAAAKAEGILPQDLAAGTLAEAYVDRAVQEDVRLSASVPFDMNSVRALTLYRAIDLSDLSERNLQLIAAQRVHALLHARQLDAAAAAARELLENLPPAKRFDPPQKFLDLKNTIATRLENVRLRLAAAQVDRLPLAERVGRLIARDAGLVQQAVSELQAAKKLDADGRMLLGDLLLRCGRPAEARAAYRRLATANAAEGGRRQATARQVRLRQALCDWAQGKLHDAGTRLRQIAQTAPSSTAGYYHASLRELTGQYPAARHALDELATDDEELARLAERIRARLAEANPPAAGQR